MERERENTYIYIFIYIYICMYDMQICNFLFPKRKTLRLRSMSKEGQSCEGAGTQILRGVAEETGIVLSVEEGLRGDLIAPCNYFERRL